MSSEKQPNQNTADQRRESDISALEEIERMLQGEHQLQNVRESKRLSVTSYDSTMDAIEDMLKDELELPRPAIKKPNDREERHAFSEEKKKLILLSLVFLAKDSEIPSDLTASILKFFILKNKLLRLEDNEFKLILRALLS